jgi:hypothetical protein
LAEHELSAAEIIGLEGSLLKDSENTPHHRL